MEKVKVEPNSVHIQIKLEEPVSTEEIQQFHKLKYVAVKTENLFVQDAPIIPQSFTRKKQIEPQFVLPEDQCIKKEIAFRNYPKSSGIRKRGKRKSDKKIRGTYGKFLCDFCGLKLTEKKSLARHMISKHIGGQKFKCEICDKKFLVVSHLKKHIDKVHNSIHYNCAHCKRTFLVKESLGKHIFQVHFKTKPKGFQCIKCYKNFLEPKYLKLHKKSLCKLYNKKTKKEILYVSCKYCYQEFAYPFILRKHIKMVHTKSNNNFKCEFCSKEFTSHAAKKYHVLAKHVYVNDNYKCKYCDKSFRLPGRLREHLMHTHEGKIMYCCHCSYGTRNKSALGVHLFRMHIPPFNKIYRKKIRLNKIKRMKARLKRKRSKTNKNKNSVDINTESAQTISLNHKEVCSSNQSGQCKLDGYLNKIQSNEVVTKSKKASKIKILNCNYCTETFTKRDDLHAHIRLKHKSQDYTCHRCNQVFNTIALKRKHCKTCTQMSKCLICFEKFDAIRKLELHKIKMHERDNVFIYNCNVCQLKFWSKIDLSNHQKQHRMTLYVCTVCLTICESGEELQQHLERHNSTFILGM